MARISTLYVSVRSFLSYVVCLRLNDVVLSLHPFALFSGCESADLLLPLTSRTKLSSLTAGNVLTSWSSFVVCPPHPSSTFRYGNFFLGQSSNSLISPIVFLPPAQRFHTILYSCQFLRTVPRFISAVHRCVHWQPCFLCLICLFRSNSEHEQCLCWTCS